MEYDDWLFDSIKRYKSLSMYDMQHCITAMDWVSGRSLCVGTSSSQKHELLELMLPDKMLETENTAKLKMDKDFRVHTGGYCKTRIADLKHIPSTRFCITAADGETSVCVWKMGDNNSDLMREEKSVQSRTSTDHRTRISICTDGATPRGIAFASTLSNITVLDCETFEKIKDGSVPERGNSDQVSSMYHQSSHLLHCCTTQGDLHICDLRCDKVKVAHQHKTETKQSNDVYWTMTKINDQSNSLLQVSSLGEVQVLDSRFMDKCVRKLHVDHRGRSDCLCIQGSQDGRHFSLSGMDGMVYIYSNAEEAVNDTLKPVFIHEGHVMNCGSQSESPVVVGHMWHPWQQDLIISTATDSSLHAWQYNTS